MWNHLETMVGFIQKLVLLPVESKLNLGLLVVKYNFLGSFVYKNFFFHDRKVTKNNSSQCLILQKISCFNALFYNF